MRYCLNYSGSTLGFCPLKIKITQFPDGFRLISHIVNDIFSSSCLCTFFRQELSKARESMQKQNVESVIKTLVCNCNE